MGRLGDLSPAASVAVGILVGLLSTSIQSIGLTLQRKSHLLEDSKEDELSRRPPYRRRKWQLGMFMFVVANLVGSTIQITTLPLPVLSTLQASGLVFNTICATLILSEPFTRWSLGGTVLVAGGALLIALFGALPEPTHNLTELLGLMRRPQFIVWMLGTFLMIGLVLAGAILLPRLTRLSHQYHLLHNQHVQRTSPRARLLIGMSYGFVSAILSAHSLLVAKSAVELIVVSLPFTSFPTDNQFKHYQSYLIVLTLIVFALSQLYFLHRGLKLTSTSVLYPFVFCIYNIIAILDGLIYFDQTERLPASHAGLIALGTVILLGGVVALSWRLEEQGMQQEREYGVEVAVTPTAQVSALAPGMGLIEDTATESPTPESFENDLNDEETGRRLPVSESTPLLATRATSRAMTNKSVDFDTNAGVGRRPNTSYGTSRSQDRPRRGSLSILTAPTPRRTRFAAPTWDRGEVWSALMDDKEARLFPLQEREEDDRFKRHRRRRTIVGLSSGRSREAHGDGEDESEDDPKESSVKARESLRRSRTVPLGDSTATGEEGDEDEAWKKRRRRVPIIRPPQERRSVSTPLLGRSNTEAGNVGRNTTGKRKAGMFEWVSGLVVSSRHE